jgi:hypothetical protein
MTAVTLATLAAVVTPGAGANHSVKEHVSIGPAGGNGVADVFLGGVSANGLRVFFDTDEQLVAADTDGSFDLYQRQGGTTTLLSTGPSGGNGAFDIFFSAASADGTRAFFETDEQLTPGDTDSAFDVYERAGGTTTLISTGSPGGNGPHDVIFHEISRDGTRAFFETEEQLLTSDTDAEPDIYERSGGTTTRVSTGPNGGNGATFFPSWGGVSDDGTRVFFETDEQLLGTDTDVAWDVYERTAGTTTLVSTGPSGGNGNFDAGYRDTSANGSHVFFHTQESLVGTDTDAATDVYDRSGGSTTLLSIGPSGGNGALPAVFEGASSDGTRVFFSTNEVLTGSDTDARKDIYSRAGATTDHVSTGPAGGNGLFDADFVGASLDGSRAYIQTEESLVATDTDTGCALGQGPQCRDVYERAAGSTTRISTGPAGGNGAFDANFAAVSADGTRVFFDTRESLTTSDTDTSVDVYERFGGTTTHISVGPAGGNGAFHAFMFETWLSYDGTRAFFDTGESLMASDTDTSLDIYGATVPFYPRPVSAVSLTASLVPAFTQCAAANRTHGPPLSGPSCNPPALVSDHARTGTSFVGSVRYSAIVGMPGAPDDSDVKIVSSLADVRCVTAGANCGAANAAGPADYTGELRATIEIRMTDRWNATAPGGGTDHATSQDVSLSGSFPCAPTAATAWGSTCSLNTSVNAITPGLVKDDKRAIWELGQAQIYDGGPDGDADTVPGDTLYAVQGVFIP